MLISVLLLWFWNFGTCWGEKLTWPVLDKNLGYWVSNEVSWEETLHTSCVFSAGERAYVIYSITEGRQNQSPVHRFLQIPLVFFSFIDLLCFPHSCNKSYLWVQLQGESCESLQKITGWVGDLENPITKSICIYVCACIIKTELNNVCKIT